MVVGYGFMLMVISLGGIFLSLDFRMSFMCWMGLFI